MISISPIVSQEQMREVIALERQIWQYGDLDVDPPSILAIASRFVGQLIAAFDGQRMVGFALSFYTASPGRVHSHRVGVLPGYRSRGIGRMLKLAQRENALATGVHTMQWTFDPLQPGNAHFNLVRLGGVATCFLPNFYGITSSPLHAGLPTDRLLIEWRLKSRRVLDALAGKPRQLGPGVSRIYLPAPEERRAPEALRQLGEQFARRLAEGYLVTGFEQRGERGSHPAAYLLERAREAEMDSSDVAMDPKDLS